MLSIFGGFCVGVVSFFVAPAYLIYKFLFWSTFQLGTAPLVIGMCFIGAVQLVFIGLLGEYIGSIHTQIRRRPSSNRERKNQL